jgi:hypothetical protein
MNVGASVISDPRLSRNLMMQSPGGMMPAPPANTGPSFWQRFKGGGLVSTWVAFIVLLLLIVLAFEWQHLRLKRQMETLKRDVTLRLDRKNLRNYLHLQDDESGDESGSDDDDENTDSRRNGRTL